MMQFLFPKTHNTKHDIEKIAYLPYMIDASGHDLYFQR